MQKISPFLWFDHQAEEAAKFYVSVFKNSKIVTVNRYSKASAEASGRPEGSVMVVSFQLNGQDFTALNGGPMFTFTPAISLVANCDTQAEVDHLWATLSDGGQPGQCGWLTDKFGVSWQIVPTALAALMQNGNPAKAAKVIDALMPMTKIDIATLQRAYEEG